MAPGLPLRATEPYSQALRETRSGMSGKYGKRAPNAATLEVCNAMALPRLYPAISFCLQVLQGFMACKR